MFNSKSPIFENLLASQIVLGKTNKQRIVPTIGQTIFEFQTGLYRHNSTNSWSKQLSEFSEFL